MEQQCRIVRESGPAGGAITFSIRGKFDEFAVAAFQERIHDARNERVRIYVDLSEVTLLDQEAARCLSAERLAGVTYLNCPPYFRRWIFSDSGTAWRNEL